MRSMYLDLPFPTALGNGGEGRILKFSDVPGVAVTIIEDCAVTFCCKTVT